MKRIDSDEFRSLYLRLRPELESAARRYLKRPQEIEDVVQETLLRLYLATTDFDSDVQALAFARRVLTNICIDRFRALGRRPSVISLEGSLAYQLPDDDDTDVVVKAEDASIVREALSQLTPEHRAALLKREVEEKPLPMIADELGIPVESVKHLLFRARRSLRRQLTGTSVEPGVSLEPVQRDDAGPHEAGFSIVLP
jgi:RNA polymerase sigma factor (sigma-70 family)